MTTEIVADFNGHPSECITTATLTPIDKYTKTASVLISLSISTTGNKKLTVSVTNNQYNRVTLYLQEGNTNCRGGRRDSGTKPLL